MKSLIWKSLLLSTALGVLFAGHAIAERQAGQFTLSPMVGYHKIDDALDLENSEVYGLGFGYNYTPEWTIEADFRFTPTEVEDTKTIDVNIWSVSLGGLYHFNPQDKFNPYLSLGAGFISYDFERSSHDDEDAFGYYGGGFKYALSESADLRLDLRHILDYRSDNRGAVHDDSDWRHHLQTMLGVSFNFGGSAAPVIKKAAVPMVQEAPADSDQDRVFDPQDQCPDTAPGVRVDSVGCPADTDGDGVADFKDACIDTPQGTKVDQYGCPEGVEEVASLTLQIRFGFDKADVTPFHFAELKRAASFIKQYPMYQVVVEGHTDSQGAAWYNQKLSQRRAESVRDALINKYGLAAGQVSATGYGQSQPFADNNSEETLAKNRRVEISIRPK